MRVVGLVLQKASICVAVGCQAHSWSWMLMGRTLFGMGGESLQVAQNTLQNFFKAMQVDQQQWAKCKKLLTADQMQTLQELKGTQSYFS